MQRQNTEKRFWSKVEKRGPDECWMWTGSKHRLGYGTMMFRGKVFTAHRLGYLLTFGEFDQTLDCCHTCDTPECCNPNHIFLGKAKDNIRDAIKKGRFCKGETNGKSKLTEKQVLEIRERYGSTMLRCIDVAKEFGVSEYCVHSIVAGVTWKHITGGMSIVRKARGEVAGNHKLTEHEVKQIRQCYALGHLTMREIGKRFNICATNVCDIIHRRTWNHIPIRAVA